MPDRHYYDALELTPAASPREITEAFRLLAGVWHPDRFKQGSRSWTLANSKMQELNAAYEVLKDPVRRAAYDRNFLSQPVETDGPGESGRPADTRAVLESLTIEQERLIDRNRRRYGKALRSTALRQFCESLNLEPARMQALHELSKDCVDTAKALLLRYNRAARG